MHHPALWLKWLLPSFLILLGVILYVGFPGHSTLGLAFLGIAALIVCYYLLSILQTSHMELAKVLRLALSILLCFGLLLCSITEAMILRASKGSDQQDSQYVVVLGAGINGSTPSRSLQDRINAAYVYLSQHPDVVAILSGGQGEDEDLTEAACIFQHLTNMGIDPDRLWLEEKATSTKENLQFSLELIEAKTGQRPATLGVLSSEYHLFRANLFAKEYGITAQCIPAATSWITVRINYSLREIAGVWYYLIFGG